jgi:hypothetical protein
MEPRILASGFRHQIAELIRRVDPQPDHLLRIRQRLFLRGTMGAATRQLRHLGDERVILIAPVNDNAVLAQNLSRFSK